MRWIFDAIDLFLSIGFYQIRESLESAQMKC
jgi:hypothetical protein